MRDGEYKRFNLTFGEDRIGGWIDVVYLIVWAGGGRQCLKKGTDDLIIGGTREDYEAARFDWTYPVEAAQ